MSRCVVGRAILLIRQVANNGRFLTGPSHALDAAADSAGQNPNSATPLGAELVKAIKASA